MKDKIERILLIRFGSLGDVVLTLPVVEAVRKAFPNAYVAMLVGDRSADVVTADTRLDEVIIFKRNLNGIASISELNRIIHVIKARNFDISIDLQRKFRSSYIAFCGNVRERIGYHQPYGFLCTVKVPDKGNIHAVDRNLRLLAPLGIRANVERPIMMLSSESRAFADNFFRSKGLENSLTVGMFVGAGWRHRCWMPERFAKIGDLASQRYNAKILVFGGPDEKDIVKEVLKNMNHEAIPIPGENTIQQLAGLISKCHVFISNDTGPMHISVALNVPTIALFGPGNHIKFQPIGERHTTIKKALPCSPCKQFTDKCKDNICMKSITIEDVWDAVQRTIDTHVRTHHGSAGQR